MAGVSSVSLRIEEALKENGIDEVLDATVFKLPPGAKLSAGANNGDELTLEGGEKLEW